jgi:hypothetical protein
MEDSYKKTTVLNGGIWEMQCRQIAPWGPRKRALQSLSVIICMHQERTRFVLLYLMLDARNFLTFKNYLKSVLQKQYNAQVTRCIRLGIPRAATVRIGTCATKCAQHAPL